MNKNFKKLLIPLGICVAAVIAGCGDNSQNDADENSPSSPETIKAIAVKCVEDLYSKSPAMNSDGKTTYQAESCSNENNKATVHVSIIRDGKKSCKPIEVRLQKIGKTWVASGFNF
jgi:hypothetical protein